MSYWALKYIGWMKDPQNGDYTETSIAKKDLRYKQLYWRFEGYIPKPEGMNKLQYDTTYNFLPSALTPHVLLDKWWRSNGSGTIGTKVPTMRVAEFYLTRSIISFKAGQIPAAMADVNLIRTEDSIHAERIKEYMGEGDRINYLISNGLQIGAGDRPASNVVNSPYSDWYLNVPKTERDMNDAYR
jgi:hypothetical protein